MNVQKSEMIFISYSREDTNWLSKFKKRFEDVTRYQVWRDKDDLKVGLKWWKSICQAIESCNYFFYISTSTSSQSPYCRAELGYAYHLNKPIIPIILSYSQDTVSEYGQIPEVDIQNLPSFLSPIEGLAIYDNYDLVRTILTIEQSLSVIRLEKECGENKEDWFETNIDVSKRPELPTEDDIKELEKNAMSSYREEEYEDAILFFNNIIQSRMSTSDEKIDATELKLKCEYKLERKNVYEKVFNVLQILDNPDDDEIIQKRWQRYKVAYFSRTWKEKTGLRDEYDPHNIETKVQNRIQENRIREKEEQAQKLKESLRNQTMPKHNSS